MRPIVIYLLLAGILLLALVIRAIDVNGQALFVDEIYEIGLSKAPVQEIVVAENAMPPLYHLLLKAWSAPWHTDDAARWFSVACGVASIACVWAIGRRLVNEATGLAAALLTAVLPLHVYYSEFARCYALLFLFAALDLWLLLRALDTDRWRDWAAFAVVAVLGSYTHYYFVIFLATSVTIVLVQRRQLWIGRRAFAAYAVAALAALPLLWLLPNDLSFQKHIRDPRPVSLATLGYTYFSIFSGYTLGPSQPELQSMSGSAAIRAAAPWIAAVGIVLLAFAYEGFTVLWARGALPVVLVVLLVPALMLATMSIVGGLNYNVRFVYWSLIAVSVWFGAGLTSGWNRWPARIALVGFLLLSATAIYNRHAVARYQNEDLRGAAVFLRAHANPDDNVYIVSDYLADSLRYYLGDGWRVLELPVPGEVNHIVKDPSKARSAWRTVNSQTPPDRNFWVIYSRGFHGDKDAMLLKTMLEQDRKVATAEELAGVTIYRGPVALQTSMNASPR